MDLYRYRGAATADGGDNFTVTDTTAGIVYKVAFDAASAVQIAIGAALNGGIGGGAGLCVNIVYDTATTGNIWFVEQAGALFIDDEVVDDGGGNTITLNGAPAEDVTFYELGEIDIKSGLSNGFRRAVRTVNLNDRYVMSAFPTEILNGTIYDIYPGCNKATEHCSRKFGNPANFYGFKYVPKPEEVIF